MATSRALPAGFTFGSCIARMHYSIGGCGRIEWDRETLCTGDKAPKARCALLGRVHAEGVECVARAMRAVGLNCVARAGNATHGQQSAVGAICVARASARRRRAMRRSGNAGRRPKLRCSAGKRYARAKKRKILVKM